MHVKSNSIIFKNEEPKSSNPVLGTIKNPAQPAGFFIHSFLLGYVDHTGNQALETNQNSRTDCRFFLLGSILHFDLIKSIQQAVTTSNERKKFV